MKKKNWYIATGALITLIVVDQLTKWIAVLLLSSKDFMSAPIGFLLYKEPLVLSNTLNIFQYIKTISSFGFSIFFLFLFFVLNLVLTHRLMGFRISFAFFTAGILGESVDIIFRGSTLEWIVFFNYNISLAQIYILIGTVFILFFCIKDRAILFHKNNLRSKMFVEKDQSIFCCQILFCYILFIGAYYMFFLSFMNIIFSQFVQTSESLQGQLMSTFFILFSILSICFLLIMTMFSVYLSNKIYGPVYAFKKYLKDIFMNEMPTRPFKTRKGDHFDDIPDLINELQSKYIKKEKE